MSERGERTSQRTREWSSTYFWICVCSDPTCVAASAAATIAASVVGEVFFLLGRRFVVVFAVVFAVSAADSSALRRVTSGSIFSTER